MKSPLLNAGMRRWMLLAGLLVALAPAGAPAQIASLKKLADNLTDSKPPPAEKTEDPTTRLEQWGKEARDMLARLDAPSAASALPEGITTEDLDERRRNLEQMALATTRALKNVSAGDDARKALEASRAADAAWTGFKTKPPYSLLLIDDLLNERDAVTANLRSFESSLANFERILGGGVTETKAAEEEVNSALGELQKATDATLAAAKWRLEAARGRSRLQVVRVGLFQRMIESHKDRIAAAKIDLALLERQVNIAKVGARFSDEDFVKLGKISEERKQAIRKELEAVAKRLKSAINVRSQAQATLDALTPAPAATPAAAESPALELAKYRLEVAEGRVETMQALAEGLESLTQLENVCLKAYQDRRALVEAKTPQHRTQALDALGVPRENLWAWVNVVDDELARTSAEFSKLESRAASISSDDPRFSLLNEQRSYTSDKRSNSKET